MEFDREPPVVLPSQERGRRWPALPVGVERFVQQLVQCATPHPTLAPLDGCCGASSCENPPRHRQHVIFDLMCC